MTRQLRRILLVGLGALAVMLGAATLAWACVPGPGFSVGPNAGPAGSSATAWGSGFRDRPVEIRWNSEAGPVLAAGTPQNGSLSLPITIPGNAPPGVHYVVSRYAGCTPVQHECHGGAGVAPFCVTPHPCANAAGPNPSITPSANARKRARAVARCKRRYRGRSRRATRKRNACIRRAKKRYRS